MAATSRSQEIREALASGERRIEIARRFGVSTTAVSYHARRLGLPLVTDTIHEEIAKCDVRCATCHRKKTARETESWRWRLAQ